jgi:hypothetical protein
MEPLTKSRSELRLSPLISVKFMRYYLGFIVASFLLPGCMLINPMKRMDLGEVSFKKPLPNVEKRVVVLFEEVVPGKPLNETVWDSAIGPYWDQDESRQIGVTVSYRVDPVIMSGGATAATTAQGARWVVPFGPLISYMMKSALEQHFLGGDICYTDTCVRNAIASGHVGSLLRVRPAFRVWTPSPTSLTLNYSSDISFGVYSSPSFELSRSGRSFLSKPDMKLNRIISYKAISEMRDYSKEYAEEVVWDVLTKAYAVK